MHHRVLRPVLVDVRFVTRPASLLGTINGLDKIHKKIFLGKSIRQMARGQVDKNGKDVSDYIVVADAGNVVIFDDRANSRRWTKNKNQVNIEIAPSLTYTKSEATFDSEVAVASMEDTANLLIIHPKMKSFNLNVFNVYVQHNKCAVGGIVRAVREAPSPSQGLSPDCFVVPCMNASLYGKHMRDILIVDFYINSDIVIRFRSSDGKVVITDLLVGVGMYANVKEAHDAMSLMFGNQDKMIARLESLEVDEKLLENEV